VVGTRFGFFNVRHRWPLFFLCRESSALLAEALRQVLKACIIPSFATSLIKIHFSLPVDLLNCLGGIVVSSASPSAFFS